MTTTPSRRILLVTHVGRPEAQQLAADVATRLIASGVGVCAPPDELVGTPLADVAGVEASAAGDASDGPDSAAAGCELVCVLGGDGTILRGAELSRGSGVPLLGVNLGHVGFLAEAEREDLDATVERIVVARLHRRGAHDPRGARLRGRPPGVLVVGAERGDRREGLARADARAHRRHRRPPAVDLGLRRHRHGDAHRLHRLRVLGRRARSCGPTSRRCSSCRSARTPSSPGPWSSARSPASSSRCWPAPRAPASCGATAAAPSTCRRARASRCTAPTSRCGWPACRTAAFTDRLVEKFRPAGAGLARSRRRDDVRRRPGRRAP